MSYDPANPMPVTDDFRVHEDLVTKILDERDIPTPRTTEDRGLYDLGDQMIVLQDVSWGTSEADHVIVCGFYLKWGNVSVAVNHTEGMATTDDADLMFPTPKED